MNGYEKICAISVQWYREHGSYPRQRIRKDKDGIEYVIGDWSWNEYKGFICKCCGQEIRTRTEYVDEQIDSLLAKILGSLKDYGPKKKNTRRSKKDRSAKTF